MVRRSVGYFADLSDIHPLAPANYDVRNDENTGSGAVEAVKVFWLGDRPPVAGANKTGFRLPQPAEALCVRDWQNSGVVGGSLAPRGTRDDLECPIPDEILIDETADSNAIGLSYGVGTMETDEQTQVNAFGGVIGDSYWTSDIENLVIGPKAGLVWRNRRGPWSFGINSSLLLGLNSGQIGGTSKFGEERSPGALIRSFTRIRLIRLEVKIAKYLLQSVNCELRVRFG